VLLSHKVSAHLCLHGPEPVPAVSCRHSSVMSVVGHTFSSHCCYLHGVWAITKLYCLATETLIHVCEQLAQMAGSWTCNLLIARPTP